MSKISGDGTFPQFLRQCQVNIVFPVFLIFFVALLGLFKVIFEFTGETGFGRHRLICFFVCIIFCSFMASVRLQDN